jgi:hypothetical protein
MGQTVFGDEGKMKSRPPHPAKPRPKKKTANQELAAELNLRLQIRDDLNRNDMLRLSEDVTMFVRTLIKANNKVEAAQFIAHNKDHFTPEIKDMISNEISLMGVN